MKQISKFLTTSNRICPMPYALCLALLAVPASANLPPEPFMPRGHSQSHMTPMAGNIWVHGDVLAMDAEDPMFFEAMRQLTSRTTFSVGNRRAQLGQEFSYGINGNMVFSAGIGLSANYHEEGSGFSNIALQIKYRTPSSGNIKTDIFGGINVAGTGATDVPAFARLVYVAGARVGRQWQHMTIAGTVQSSWIFDETRGMAYLDFTPEIYFRLIQDWSLGLHSTLRRATTPHFNQEWLGAKIAHRIGRTQYVGMFDYEFNHDEWRVGFRLNMLF